MRIFLVLVLLAAGLMPLFAQDKVSDPDRQVMARITVTNDLDMQRIARLGLDLMEYREGDDLIFLTTQGQLDELRNAGWNVRIDERLTAELPRPGDTETFMGGYRTVEETFAFLNQMAAAYPYLAEVFTYGQSWEKTQNPLNGYDLKGIKLTNREIRIGEKPKFFLQAGIHARELVPPELATRFIQYLLANYGIDGDATWLLDEHEIIVVPILNPDGRKIAETGQSKRKNTNSTTGSCSLVDRGIDLNRNYSFWWGTVNMPTDPPCGATWPGLTAASEPEIYFEQALLTSLFPDQRPNDRTTPAPLDATGVYLDMHSTGNLVLYPWGEDELPPPNMQLQTIAQKMASYNGYNPIQSVQLYPTSGSSKDYAYGELGVAGLSTETGLGSGSCGGFMPQYTCLDGGTGGNFWNLNRPVLLYLAKLARTPYMTSEGPTPETFSVTRTRLNRYTLRAQISDQNNGGQNVTAAELYIDVPPWRGGTPILMTAEDGSFNSPTEFAVANITVAGSRLLYVRARDSAGNWGVMKGAFTTPRLTIIDN
ncbi:MAG: M14 family zinc carboxypeptidase [Pyrinomonadaceae bacterium]